MPDDMDGEQWLRLGRAFDGTRDFRVSGELATNILRSLCPVDTVHKIVFPALQNLHIQEPMPMPGPLWDSVKSFDTQRLLSSHPVQTYYSDNKVLDVQTMAILETFKSIDENPEDAEAESNVLDEILRTYPPAPKINDLAVAYSSRSSDPSLTPRPTWG